MRISQAFPSKYLKAADLDGREVTIKMKEVAIEDLGDDKRPVLYFIGTDKALVLNKTNANVISDLYGDDTDDWHGKEITLVEREVDYAGKSVPAIRVLTKVKKRKTPEVDEAARDDRRARKAIDAMEEPRRVPATEGVDDVIPW